MAMVLLLHSRIEEVAMTGSESVTAAKTSAAVASKSERAGSGESAAEPAALHDLPVECIDPDPNNPRSQCPEEKVEAIRLSLLAIGQQQPIIVERTSATGRYLIVHGHIRFEGTRLAGRPTIKAIVLPGSLSPAERLARQLSENDIRASLTPIDQARAYHRLLVLEGITQSALAQKYGFRPYDVSRSLALIHKLPEFFQEKIGDGTVPESCGYLITTVENELDRVQLAQRFLDSPMTKEKLTREISLMNGRRKSPAESKPTRQLCLFLDDPAVELSFSRTDERELRLETVLTALELATKHARKAFQNGGVMADLADRFKKPRGQKPSARSAAQKPEESHVSTAIEAGTAMEVRNG
jgi:ParB family chromosome partitioning protein